MSYPIKDIEGIGDAYTKKLAAAGIKTTGGLLRKCASRKGRKHVSKECDISEKHILKWTNLADLMRITGVATQFSELLEAAGVDTVKELKTRRADNLAAKMAEVNAKKKLTRQVPTESQVQGWVDQAKKLNAVIEY